MWNNNLQLQNDIGLREGTAYTSLTVLIEASQNSRRMRREFCPHSPACLLYVAWPQLMCLLTCSWTLLRNGALNNLIQCVLVVAIVIVTVALFITLCMLLCLCIAKQYHNSILCPGFLHHYFVIVSRLSDCYIFCIYLMFGFRVKWVSSWKQGRSCWSLVDDLLGEKLL